MGSRIYKVAIVGGGIIGLATAMALAKRYHDRLAVLEAEAQLARHQTGHNSGVIHSGLYYRPGSLKATNCTAGREALLTFCRAHGIAHEVCGKLVLAVDREEAHRLDELHRRGLANGLQGIRRLGPEEIGHYEPHATGVAALWVPQTGIVDFTQVARACAREVEAAGGRILTSARVEAVRADSGCLTLVTCGGEVFARNLINCAGLQSDRVARLCGLRPECGVIPFRGEYYRLRPERRRLVRNLLYPVPDPEFPFLGVHFTRTIGGEVDVGPNAVLSLARQKYDRRSFDMRDVFEMLGFAGFWRMGSRHWRSGLAEWRRSFVKRRFTSDLQRLVPVLNQDDLEPATVGIRAQAVRSDGSLIDDFVLQQAPRMIHVLNAPSPAATASLAIGRAIAALALRDFD